MTRYIIAYLWEEFPKYDKYIIKNDKITCYYKNKIVREVHIYNGMMEVYPKNLNITIINAESAIEAIDILKENFEYNILMTYIEEIDNLYEYGRMSDVDDYGTANNNRQAGR